MERELEVAEELSGVGHWRLDLREGTLYWSPQARRIHGRDAADLDAWLDGCHPDDREDLRRNLQSVTEDGSCRCEQRYVLPGGELRNVHCSARIERDERGAPAFVFGIFQDVTAQRVREATLEQLNHDLHDRIQEVRERNADLAGLTEMTDLLQCVEREVEVGQVPGLLLPRLFARLDGAVYLTPAGGRVARRVAEWGETPHLAELTEAACWGLRRGTPHRAQAPCGQPCTPNAGCCPPVDRRCLELTAQGEQVGVMVLAAGSPEAAALLREKGAIAEAVANQLALAVSNVRLRDRLRESATRDPLTGLFNRRYAEEAFERERARVERSGGRLAVAILDVDHFKRFNDQYGHAVGDLALQSVAELMRHLSRAEDLHCRWGGEEFLLVSAGTDGAAMRQLLERLQGALRAVNLLHDGHPCHALTFSAGVAVFPDNGRTLGSLGRVADAALYQAKEGGRDQVVVAPAEARAGAIDAVDTPLPFLRAVSSEG